MTAVARVTDGTAASAPTTPLQERAGEVSTIRIAFVGPPGSGKGTQAALLAERHELAHISTGELLRAIAAQESDAGAWVRDVMATGDLIPDGFVLDLVTQEIRRCRAAGQGFILDGFPRTVSQCASLSNRFGGLPLDLVLAFRVGREQIQRRLASRGRADDSPATVARRLESYREATVPMVRYMATGAPVVVIDGDAPVEMVHTAITEVVARQIAEPPPGPAPASVPLATETTAPVTPVPRLSRKDHARSLLRG